MIRTTPEMIEQACSLAREGKTRPQIAKALGMSTKWAEKYTHGVEPDIPEGYADFTTLLNLFPRLGECGVKEQLKRRKVPCVKIGVLNYWPLEAARAALRLPVRGRRR